MKIALIGPIPPPSGGMAMQTMQLHRLLTERGHTVTLIPVNPPYQPAFMSKIPVVRALYRLVPYLISLWQGLKNQDVVHLMANSGWAFHLFARPAIVIANKRGVPVLLNYRGGSAQKFFAKSWSHLQASFTNCAMIAVPSGFLADVFQQYQTKTQIVPNIIDLSIFQYQEPAIDANSLHIIVTRNLEPLYDNESAIIAFTQLLEEFPQARLTIAGSGHSLNALQALTEKFNITERVEFVGRLNRQQIAELYQQADIMINPSTIDNMPNSILEAMASGCNVVSTNVGGIPYMVEDGKHVLLVKPNAPNELTEAVRKLVTNSALANELAENGRQKVIKLTPEQIMPLLESHYHQLGKTNA